MSAFVVKNEGMSALWSRGNYFVLSASLNQRVSAKSHKQTWTEKKWLNVHLRGVGLSLPAMS
jgi:hypothetical protein